MSKQNNGILLKQLFQLAEQDNLDKKLEKLLDETIESISLTARQVEIHFKNGVQVLIKSNFDLYHMYISDNKFYMTGDNAYSPMGPDRILFYLKSIANFKFDWRKKCQK